MENELKGKTKQEKEKKRGITAVTVSGYKSICSEQRIEVRPLTILAGANSSGKSSIIQPLLLLKQTLEASYDPGPLLLNGPNVKFTSADQLLCKNTTNGIDANLCIGIEVDAEESLSIALRSRVHKGFEIMQTTYFEKGKEPIVLRPEMKSEEITSLFPEIVDSFSKRGVADAEWRIERERCFLVLVMKWPSKKQETIEQLLRPLFRIFPTISVFEPQLRKIIHLPGIRGNPERTYPTTAVGSSYQGTFQDYVASIILNWQTESDQRLDVLSHALDRLGLTWKVLAKPINDTQVELHIGRLLRGRRGGARDTVSIADVGFGVSQTLPVLVALIAAEPGQLVYLEQPEIHLHPRAQIGLAEVLAEAAGRGVRVVAETHSSILLLAIQTLVAEGRLDADLIGLNWFTRDEDGITKIAKASLDESGAFGDWPEDFGSVALTIESRYLDAVDARHGKL